MSGTVDTELALLIDVGSTWVKAGVIGRVRGRWRLVAHAAQPTAWGSSELRRTLAERLGGSADPRLAGRLDEIISRANRIECHTARAPGRLAVVAVSRELSGGAARRAAEAAGWQVSEMVTLDDGRGLAERLATLQSAEVDAWLLAGGFDDVGTDRALEAAALAASSRRAGNGPVVWAGTRLLADEVAALFEPGAVTSAPNPRPDARHEDLAPLRAVLQGLMRAAVAPDEESHLASIAFPRTVGALAASSGLRILAVDLGARGATRAIAEPDGTVASRINARGGLAGAAAAAGAAGRVARLAGDAGDDAAVADLLQTIRARPAGIPQTAEELSVTQAAARMQLAALMDDGAVEGPFDLLIGAGRTIACAPHPAQAFRMLLDGIRPLGVTQVAIDPASVLGPLGSMRDDEMREGLALLADDALVPLGTAVVCRGGRPGQTAMRVMLHRPGWPTPAPVEVRNGTLQVLPLPAGQEAELTIEPGDGVSLGPTRRSPRIRAQVTGGAVGLVLDARGVPIALPRRADDRRAVLAGWREALEREPSLGAGERVA